MTVYIADTETTGLVNQQPIEICHINIDNEIDYHRLKLGNEDSINDLVSCTNNPEIYLERFKPSIAINEHASKVNNIYMKDLLKCRKTSEYILPDIEYLIAHNAQFDYRTLYFDGCHPETAAKKSKVKLICTKELAQIVFAGAKGLKNNKLTTLIEYLYPEHYYKFESTTHTALTDCKMVYLLLLKILEKFPKIKTWEELANLCNQPKDKETNYDEMNQKVEILETINFGKYKDKLFSEVPLSYLSWLIAQAGNSPSIKATCNYHLNEKRI